MTRQATSKRRFWVLGLALCAALTLCWTRSEAATYEEGGGAAAVTAQQTRRSWAHKPRTAVSQAALERALKELWLLPPSGKKPTLQKKAPSPH